MKRVLNLLAGLCLVFLGHAQNGSADFDGVNGVITVSNGSAMIANSTGMTIEGWVFPRNTSPSFPDFDGFFGWRNEFDADFYLLHLNTNRVEGRLRTNQGLFTVSDTGLVPNQWNHLALVYNGSSIQVFINGRAGANLNASGTITDSTETLYIGNLVFQNTNFYLDGMVDEFRVWRTARTTAQINALRFVEIANTSSYPGLAGYFKLNDPVGSLTAREDVAGRNGVLAGGVKFTNASAPLFNGPIGYANQAICDGDSILIGGAWRKMAGTYRDTIMRTGMPDSLVFITLTVAQKPLIPGIVKSDWDSLSCNIAATSYTWFRDGMKLSDTTRKIRFTQSGNYRVIAYNFHCPSDTSPVFMFQVSGWDKIDNSIGIYPNPFSGFLNIIGEVNSAGIRVFDMQGRLLFNHKLTLPAILELGHLPPGTYVLEAESEGIPVRKRILKLE